jgi:ribosome biogenesis GTPase A
VLEKVKNELSMLKYLPKVYVLGSTNAGKSSVINAMLAAQNKKKYKKKDSFVQVVTQSALPGTTQEFLTIEQFRLGMRVIDTPGIPNTE